MIGGLPVLSRGSIVTVGSFDGVHLGHRAVVQEIAERAAVSGRASVLVTFEPHPLAVVRPEAAPKLLTTPVERREMFAQLPLDYVVFLRFDERLAALPPDRFVRTVLREGCGMQELVIGYDHGFGRGRTGDVRLLRELGAADGFTVDVVPPFDGGDGPVSSSRVRDAVAAGDLGTAARLLGRPYHVTGRVARGDGRGRKLGVPTINVPDVPVEKLLPPDGVYAVRVEWRGGSAGGMMNQGGRPTFGDDRRGIEVNLFEVEDDLYGEWVRVQWVGRLRDVRRFDSARDLQIQLERDRAAAAATLAATSGGPNRVHHA